MSSRGVDADDQSGGESSDEGGESQYAVRAGTETSRHGRSAKCPAPGHAQEQRARVARSSLEVLREDCAGSIPVTANEETAFVPPSKPVVNECQVRRLVHEVAGLESADGDVPFCAGLEPGPYAELCVEASQGLPNAATDAHTRRHPFDQMLFVHRLRHIRLVPVIGRDESGFRIVGARLNVAEDDASAGIDLERLRQLPYPVHRHFAVIVDQPDDFALGSVDPDVPRP